MNTALSALQHTLPPAPRSWPAAAALSRAAPRYRTLLLCHRGILPHTRTHTAALRCAFSLPRRAHTRTPVPHCHAPHTHGLPDVLDCVGCSWTIHSPTARTVQRCARTRLPAQVDKRTTSSKHYKTYAHTPFCRTPLKFQHHHTTWRHTTIAYPTPPIFSYVAGSPSVSS